MGGVGSGRYGYATTPTVEECRHLDVDDLTDLTEHIGARAKMWWGDRDDPDASIVIYAEGEDDLADTVRPDRLRLEYTATDTRTDDTREYEYAVPLDYTECNFGGFRPWVRCPKCRTRRRKLYLPPGRERFLCRECYDLGYRTSRTSGDDVKQAELRYRRAFAKADKADRRPHPNGSPYLPERPKGMHRDTFADLMDDARRAREEWDAACREKLRTMASRLQGVEERLG